MENIYNIQCSQDYLVVQANELIRSKQDSLTLPEAKLIKLVISQIVMSDIELKTYSCGIADLADYIGIDPKNLYRDIDSLSISILKKLVYIRDKAKPTKRNGEPNFKRFQWLSSFEYRDGIITVRINDDLKPYLVGLHTLFTKYGYSNILNLSTANSIRLYELLASYEYTVNTYNPRFTPTNLFPHIPKEDNQLIFSIEYLKGYFNCVDKYPNTGDFIKWVIDPSVKNINEKSDMRVSYLTAKEGRKIKYLLFKINAWGDKDFIEFLNNK